MVTPLKIIFITLIVFTNSHSQVLSDEKAKELSNSVMKIYAKHSNKKDVAATGFLFKKNNLIVTSLHVVAGATKIQIKLPNRGELINAEIYKVLKEQDLALLKTEKNIDRQALISSTEILKKGTPLECIGYPFNIPVSDSTSLSINSVGKKLEDIIPANVKSDLDKFPFIDTGIDIINISGHLMTGHSGAPIFDKSGEVVAIANGGLAGGSGGRVWAIEAKHLEHLLVSKDDIPKTSVLSSQLFSEEINLNSSNLLKNNNLDEELVYIRSSSFSELFYTSDDQLGLNQIISTFSKDVIQNLNEYKYHIYRDRKSGSNFVIPVGFSAPEKRNDFWVSSDSNDLITLYFRVDSGKSTEKIQRMSESFEKNVFRNDDPQQWRMNPNWTYPTVRQIYSGIHVRRLTYQKYEWMINRWVELKQLLFTFSKKDSYLLSAASKLNDSSKINYYFTRPQEANDNNKIWFAGATSVFLTTFSY